ncbi:MAG: hypothetical protein KME11_01890 [Timaviella obliquedivisa GSE-PSE-MK23-08B]|nr:hypothetical protein [Timaviella obliquedivisa GSE-PSE-MK23-08B]
MFNIPVRSSKGWLSLFKQIDKPIAGLFLTLSLVAAGLPSLPASSREDSLSLTESVPKVAQVAQSSTDQPLADGVYLYGQSPKRDQINSAYLVFEVTRGQIMGAFYMPRSSFDCVYGNLQADQLALNVVDSYSRESYPYAVALQTGGAIANAQGSVPPVTLEGMHRIENITSNDQRLLSTCKADRQSAS